MGLTIGGVALTAALYTGGFWISDGLSSKAALHRGGVETNITGFSTEGIVALEAGVFTIADVAAQKTRWKPAPWIVRGFAVGVMVWLKNKNDHAGRPR